MHARGHLYEAVFKAHRNSGFHKVVKYVMQRPKAFKKRKLQEQNLQHIQEEVRDVIQAYGLAAVYEFKASSDFPSDDELKATLRRCENHNSILLAKFKKWLQDSGECDESHR
jgi:hypothetical protein